MSPRDFQGPSALDLLTDFKRHYMAFADRRVKEIETCIQKMQDALRETLSIQQEDQMYAEIRTLRRQIDEFRYFEPALNRLIQSFVQESLRPWQQAFTDALMRAPGPIIPTPTGPEA